MPRLTIDHQAVEVAPGSNLLAALRKLGVDVPALCYHPGCTPNNACMTCIVRLVPEGRLVPACATPAEDRLIVESETPALRSLRRVALELMLSDHAGARRDADGQVTCDCPEGELCRLRKYARQYDADPERFAGTRRAVRGVYEHPLVRYDPHRCILCGVCIQLARQAGEPIGLTMSGRGFDMHMDTAAGASLSEALQIAAVRCAGACPTAALTRRQDR